MNAYDQVVHYGDLEVNSGNQEGNICDQEVSVGDQEVSGDDPEENGGEQELSVEGQGVSGDYYFGKFVSSQLASQNIYYKNTKI